MNQVVLSVWSMVGEFLSSLEDLVLGMIVSWLWSCVNWSPLFGAIRSETVRWRVGKAKSPRFLQIHEGSVRALSIPILPHQASLFLSRQSRYCWAGTGGRVSGCFVEFSVVMTRVRTRWCGRMDSCKLGLPVKTFDHFLHCW